MTNPVITGSYPSSTVYGVPWTLTTNGSDFANNLQYRWEDGTYANRSGLTGSWTTWINLNGTEFAIGTHGYQIAQEANQHELLSNWASFTITSPTPVLSSISPSSKVQGAAQFNLAVGGSSFFSNSVVQWDGSSLSTTYNSSTSLTAVVPASLLVSGGNHNVTVYTPSYGTSSAKVFAITYIGKRRIFAFD